MSSADLRRLFKHIMAAVSSCLLLINSCYMYIKQCSCKLSVAGCDISVLSSILVIKPIEQLCFPYSFSLVLLIFLWSNKSIKFVYVHRMEYWLVSQENLLLTQCYIIYVAVILLK
jgi:hypothetical protein